MEKLAVIISTILLVILTGCSETLDNNHKFDVIGSNVAVVEDSAGEYRIILAFEVSNLTNNPLRFKDSDFDIVDEETDNLIDTIQAVNAYPPIVEVKNTAVYYSAKISDKVFNTNIKLKAVPHIETEKSNTKLTTLPTPGNGMNGVFVGNPLSRKTKYENVQVAVICRSPNDKIIGVLTAKIDSIEPGEEIEAIPGGYLIEKDLDPYGGGRTQYFAYLEPYATGVVEEGQTMRDIIILVFSLLILGGIIWLQIVLSKKRNKWLGLILPLINIVLSLIPTFSMFRAMSPFIPKTIEKFDEYGNLASAVNVSSNISSIILTVAMGFLIYNMTTVILMAIYWICRKKKKGLWTSPH